MKCSATTRRGEPCRFSAAFGELCVAHAASAGLPEALELQRSRLRPSPLEDPFFRYADDPVGFAIDVLGIAAWSRQADFLRAVAQHDRVALKAGQKVSKTNSLAIVMLWFAVTRDDARAFFTNSSERQVAAVNYREIRQLHRNAKIPLGGHVHDTPGRGIVWPNGNEIVGFATDEEDRWGGLSGGNLLFIVDEASGVPTSLFEAIEGNCAGDNAKLVICGNPLRPADYFYDAFNSRASSWHTMTISSLESPNVVEGREVIRGLASPGYIARVEQNYGNGPFWQARVLGEFPSQNEYTVVALGDVLAARQRHATATADPTAPLVGGLDVARFGDDESVLVLVRGDVVVGIHAFRNLDGPALAGRVAEIAQEHRRDNERVEIRVDVIGVGSSPFDVLNNGPFPWVDAVPVNVAESPTVEDHYARLRDQLWFQLAQWLKTGAIPNDEKLAGELLAPVYSFDVSGNRKVEPKDAIKKRLRRSPDRADALALAVFSTQRERTAAEMYSDITIDSLEEAFDRFVW